MEGVASEQSRSFMSSLYLRRVRTNEAVPCQYIYFLDLWEYAFLITQVIEHRAGGGVLNILVNTQELPYFNGNQPFLIHHPLIF